MPEPFRLGAWLVEPDLNRVSGTAGSSHVEPKAMDVLVYLAARVGSVVPRQQLVEAVWPGTFVTDDALRHAVAQLRAALRDDARNPRYIETIPRRGYRLLLNPVPEGKISARPGRTSGARTLAWAAPVLIGAAMVAVLLARGLPGFSSNGRPPVRSIAVLPLRLVGGDASDRPLALGLTDSLISEFAGIGAFRKVIASQSVRQYEDVSLPLRRIGKELGVEAVLEGTLQRVGPRVSVTIRLVDVSSDSVLWTGEYDPAVQDLVKTKHEIAAAVARAAGVVERPTEPRSEETIHQVDSKAVESVAVGRYLLSRGSSDDVREAIQYFTTALEAASRWTDAYVGRAQCYLAMATRPPAGLHRLDAIERARADLAEALRIAPSDPQARSLRAWLLAAFEWKWAEAEGEFRASLGAAPNRADAHAAYARFLLALGRFDEAETEGARAEELDPLNPAVQRDAALRRLFGGQLDEAESAASAILKRQPNDARSIELLGVLAVLQGRRTDAVSLTDRLLQLVPGNPRAAASAGFVYAAAGRTAAARSLLRQLTDMSEREYVAPETIAWIHAGLGQRDQAIAWLERAYADRSPEMMMIRVTPEYASLRGDARFQDLVRRMAFPR